MAQTFRDLPCRLSDSEIQAMGEQLADLELEYKRVDEERKTRAAEFRDQLESINNRIGILSREIQAREQVRQVECGIGRNERLGLIETVRWDTGEVIDRRAMTAEERQKDLFRDEVEAEPSGFGEEQKAQAAEA